MKFQVNDPNDIRWMRDPEEYDVGDVVSKLKAADKWEELLEIESEDGVVDCDALYDYLRHDGAAALLSVGLHLNEAVATVQDVLKAWAEENAEEGLKVSYCADGKTPSGLQLFDYGPYDGIDLEFESVNADGETEEVSLDPDEVLRLVGHMANGNATEGAWTCTDVEHATFEMWRGRD